MEDRTAKIHQSTSLGHMNAQSAQIVLQDIRNLEEWLELGPTNHIFVLKLGGIYERRQQYDKARNFYERYAKKTKESAQILLRLGYVYLAIDQTIYAENCWSDYIDLSNNKCQCCVRLAKQLLALSAKYPKAASFALSYALKSIQINSKEKEAWKVFVNALQAVFLINMSLNICQVLLWTFQVCIETLETDIFQKAKAIYENAFQMEKRFEFVANIGFMCQILDQQKYAIEYFRQAEKISTANKVLYYFMALSYEKQKDFKNAQACKSQYWKNQVSMSYRVRNLRYLVTATNFGKYPNNPLKDQQYQMIKHLDEQSECNRSFREQNNNQYRSNKKIDQSQRDKNIITKTEEDAKDLKWKGPIHIEKEYQYPYSAIGVIRGRISKDYQKPIFIEGTAFIISHNIIMTAAHNIYSHIHKRQCKDLCFYPAGFVKIEQGYPAKTVFFPLEYKNVNIELQEIQQNYLSDYALVELDTTDNLQQIYGSLGYSFDATFNEKKIIEEAQFIGKNPDRDRKSSDLIQFQGNALIDTHYLIHKMPTARGFSGAPVLQKIKNSYFVRGIHVKGINKIIDSGKAALKLDMSQFQMLKQRFYRDLHQYDMSNLNDPETKMISAEDLKLIIPAIAENEKNKSSSNSDEKATQNHRIMLNFFLHNIGPEGCKYLRAPQLKYLQILHLAANMIRAEGCRQLALNEWIYLRQIYLQGNDIKDEGCKYLAGANWPELRMIFLRLNDIGPQGCKYLAKNKWTKLHKIFLNENNIQDEGCKYLAEAKWDNMQVIWLHKNGITAKGCQYLSIANWRDLQQIYLDDNDIGEEGSRYISKALWNNMRLLYLFQTSIGSIGFLHLSTTKWDKLERLYLQRNNISDEGCKNLPLSQWINLRVLYLQMNQIRSEGCRYLAKTEWPRMQCLLLHQNFIGLEGCEYMSVAKWPNLRTLTLYANPISTEGYSCLVRAKLNVQCDPQYKNIMFEANYREESQIEQT